MNAARGRPDDSATAAAQRTWFGAGADAITDLTAEVRRQARTIDREVDEDAVHDMRTATRRLRTATTLYGDVISKKDRHALEDELRRIGHRLGSVRDLDVLLAEVDDASKLGADGTDHSDLGRLRRAWAKERRRSAKRLKAELDHARFEHSLERASRLTRPHAAIRNQGDHAGEAPRVGHRAPGLIWQALGDVLAYEIDRGDEQRWRPAWIEATVGQIA